MSEEVAQTSEASVEPAAVAVKEEEEEEEEVAYECPAEFDEREELRKMFVAGLDKEITDEEFKALFESYGEITDAIVMRKQDTKSDRLFGFITFSKCDAIDECLLAKPHKFKETELDVKRAVPKGSFSETARFKVKKLHLGNVPAELDTRALKKYLKSRHPVKYGTIEEIDILKAKDEAGNVTEKNRGFGFITVSNEDFADRLSIAESKFTLNGNGFKLSKARPKGEEQRGGYRGRGRGRGGYQGSRQGDWSDWSGYGAGYGYGYGYGDGGYGYADYSSYGYPAYAGGYTGRRYNPY